MSLVLHCCDSTSSSTDPTGTGKLRAQLRKLFALQLNTMRTRLRAVIIDQNCLCLTSDKPTTSLPKEVCAASFDEHLKMFSAFPANAALDLLKAATASGIKAIGSPADVDHTLIYQVWVRNEVEGIVAALKQKLARIAIDVMTVRMSKAKAFRVMSAEFDKIGTRFDALANTVVVKLHNLGRIEALRSQGVEYYGIDAERVIDAPKKRKLTYTKPPLRTPRRTRYVEVVTAGDERVCPKCEELEGRIFSYPEAIGLLPLHINCFPGDTLVSPVGRVAAVSKRMFKGDLVVIRTAGGKRLSLTINHPVLTLAGWVPAAQLAVGDHVVSPSRGDRSTDDFYNENVPTRIEKVTRTFLTAFGAHTTAVPTSADDFHGDGAYSKVAVIGTNRFLLGECGFSLFEKARDFVFERMRSTKALLSGTRTLQTFFPRLLTAAYSVVRRFAERFALFGGKFAPIFSEVGAAPSVPTDFARMGGAHLFGLTSQANTVLVEESSNDSSIDPETFGNVTKRLPFAVALDEITSLSFSEFEGYVHNLETSSGYLISDGIITHNCRCAVVGHYLHTRNSSRPPHATKDASPPWKEELHPRGGQGSGQGGKFVSKGAASSAKPTTKTRGFANTGSLPGWIAKAAKKAKAEPSEDISHDKLVGLTQTNE